jgi:Domain of unknown function (DUF4173)
VRLLAVLAAVTAAASLPYAPPGIGFPLVALLVVAAVASACRRSLDAIVFGLLALALASLPALLDARWVVTVDLLAACLLATTAVAGPRVVAPLALFRALEGVGELVPAPPASSAPALRGLALGVCLLVPFGALFWTADAAFAEIAGAAPIPSAESLVGRLVVFGLVLFGALGLALAATRQLRDPALPRPRLSVGEWAIPLALLDLLFLAFVVVQLTVLFGGHDHVLETAGLTYAEYARHGFWQLILAAALTLAVVGAAARLAVVRSPAERILLRTLLGSLCVLTLVVVASAVHRLHLYEDAFGLTRQRLAAETFSWGLGALFALVLLAGLVRAARRELPRLALAGAGVGLVAFSLSNPDGRVAQRNVERWQRTGNLDVAYLQGLSADAVPALAGLPDPLRARVLAPFEDRLSASEPLTSANYARHRARRLLESARTPPA